VLPSPVIFAPYLRTRNSPPSAAAPSPSPSRRFDVQPLRHADIPSAIPITPLNTTHMDLPVSMANKRLTENLIPLNTTLAKNKGAGAALQLSTFPRSNVHRCNSFSVTSLAAPHLATSIESHPYKNQGAGAALYFPNAPTCRSHPSPLRLFDSSGSSALHSSTNRYLLISLPHSVVSSIRHSVVPTLSSVAQQFPLWNSSTYVRLTPLQCTDPKNAPITRLECAVPKTQHLKSFRMRRCKKKWV